MAIPRHSAEYGTRWSASRSFAIANLAAFLAEDILVRDTQVLELNLGRVFCGAQGMHDAADVEAFPFRLDDEGGHAAPPRPASTCEKQSVVGAVGAANPKLGPV